MKLDNLYSTPDDLLEPDFNAFMQGSGGFDVRGYFDACEDHEKRLAEWCREWNREAGKHVNEYVGGVIDFPVADGKAQYMVLSTTPLQLIHLNYGDGYGVDEITLRGLRLADVKQLVNRNRKLAELFGRGSK